MSQTPLHDWIMPRLRALLAGAVGQGFDPLAVAAVITDIVASTDLAAAAASGQDEAPPA